MDDSRDQPAGQGSSKTPIAAAVKLSPVQQAWGDYVDHARACAVCRSVDGGKCGEAERLYRAYQDVDADAYRRLSGEPG